MNLGTNGKRVWNFSSPITQNLAHVWGMGLDSVVIEHFCTQAKKQQSDWCETPEIDFLMISDQVAL